MAKFDQIVGHVNLLRLSFRNRLIALLLLLLLGASGASLFTLWRLSSAEKIKSLVDEETLSTREASRSLQSLLRLGRLISPLSVRESDEVIFLVEDPCQRNKKPIFEISGAYVSHLKGLKLNPLDWNSSLVVSDACRQNVKTVQIVPTTDAPKIRSPYILVLYREGDFSRLAMLSVRSLSSAQDSTQFLISPQGEILWSKDGEEYLKWSMEDTETNLTALLPKILDATQNHIDANSNGLLTFFRVGEVGTFVSLVYKPSALRSVDIIALQVLFFALSFTLAAIPIARQTARIVLQPLAQMQLYAERIASGDLDYVMDVEGNDEFSKVKKTFNELGIKIQEMLVETERASNLKSELDLAQQVQNLLVPAKRSQTSHFKLSSSMSYATKCGGDWWGYQELKRPTGAPLLYLAVGDVSGHGVGSALIAGVTGGGVMGYLEGSPNELILTKMMESLNRLLYTVTRGAQTVTFFSCLIDPTKGTLTYSNAGHVKPYLLDDSGITSLGEASIPLGSEANLSLGAVLSVPWSSKNRLFLYTDGLTDFPPEVESGYDRRSLVKTLKQQINTPSEELIKKILIERKTKNQRAEDPDDISVVICENRPDSLAFGGLA